MIYKYIKRSVNIKRVFLFYGNPTTMSTPKETPQLGKPEDSRIMQRRRKLLAERAAKRLTNNIQPAPVDTVQTPKPASEHSTST